MIAEQLTPAALVLIAQKGLELAARVDIPLRGPPRLPGKSEFEHAKTSFAIPDLIPRRGGSSPAAPTGQSVSNAYGIGSRSKCQTGGSGPALAANRRPSISTRKSSAARLVRNCFRCRTPFESVKSTAHAVRSSPPAAVHVRLRTGGPHKSVSILEDQLRHAVLTATRHAYRALGGTEAEWTPRATNVA